MSNPLTLANTTEDLRLLKASNTDLSSLLGPDFIKPQEEQIRQSYEFVKNAREALAVAKSGRVESEGARIENARGILEEIEKSLEGAK